MAKRRFKSQLFEVEDPLSAIELYYQKGFTDGLPIIPPTEERVWEMLEYSGRDPQEVLGLMPPKRNAATVEKVAINAVMAGCLPAYMPVVLTAVEAILDPAFNLHAVASSTKGAAPLLIVNGPAVKELGFNAGPSVFGPGFRANATVGRAIRLIMRNIGGAIPGEMDRGTLGHPGRYSYCIAEDEAASPWEPLHVERGFPREMSCVTVFAGEGPHQVGDHISRSAEGILDTIAEAMSVIAVYTTLTRTGEILVILCPEHVETIASDGWSKTDIKRFLFERARRSADELRKKGRLKGAEGMVDERGMVPVVPSSEDIYVIVAGGAAGRFSAFIPYWAGKEASKMVTKAVGICRECE